MDERCPVREFRLRVIESDGLAISSRRRVDHSKIIRLVHIYTHVCKAYPWFGDEQETAVHPTQTLVARSSYTTKEIALLPTLATLAFR